MKNKFTWWQITSLIIELIGAVFLILCIATDTNDELFLPISLSSVLIANSLNLIMTLHSKKQK